MQRFKVVVRFTLDSGKVYPLQLKVKKTTKNLNGADFYMSVSAIIQTKKLVQNIWGY